MYETVIAQCLDINTLHVLNKLKGLVTVLYAGTSTQFHVDPNDYTKPQHQVQHEPQ